MDMRSSAAFVVAASALLVAGGCLAFTGNGSVEARRADAGFNSLSSLAGVVTARDLIPLADRSLDQALRQLRPEFVRVRMVRPGEANQPTVYVDEKYAGEADVLRSIPISVVSQVAYLTPVAARSRYGSFCPCGAGVLLITTQRQN